MVDLDRQCRSIDVSHDFHRVPLVGNENNSVIVQTANEQNFLLQHPSESIRISGLHNDASTVAVRVHLASVVSLSKMIDQVQSDVADL